MSLQTFMNLNRMVMLFAVIQSDESVQSRLPKQAYRTHFLSRVKWGEHDNCEQQLIETQFHFMCVWSC
jgi:hypothetical protein